MLCLAGAWFTSGCAATPDVAEESSPTALTSPAADASEAPPAAASTPADAAPTRADAPADPPMTEPEAEDALTRETAASDDPARDESAPATVPAEPTAAPGAPPEPPIVPGPGARAIAARLVELTESTPETPRTIRLTFSNRSRATKHEFEAFVQDIAILLQRAGASRGLVVVVPDATDPAPATHTLSATAYLMTRDGFDQWELFPVLRAVDAEWDLWRPDIPIRALRFKRPGAPRLLGWPTPAEPEWPSPIDDQ